MAWKEIQSGVFVGRASVKLVGLCFFLGGKCELAWERREKGRRGTCPDVKRMGIGDPDVGLPGVDGGTWETDLRRVLERMWKIENSLR